LRTSARLHVSALMTIAQLERDGTFHEDGAGHRRECGLFAGFAD
jgi:hypothetical protein